MGGHGRMSLSLSLHRHLRELSQGLKESHWPNAQNIPELMCQGGMSIVGFPYCYVLLTSMFGDVRCNVMLWLEGWCWMRPRPRSFNCCTFYGVYGLYSHQMPPESFVSAIPTWCSSMFFHVLPFLAGSTLAVGVGLTGVSLPNSCRCHLISYLSASVSYYSILSSCTVWCSGSRVKVTRAQTGLCASSSFHSCPRSQWWESEIMLGSFSFRHRAKLTHLFANRIHQAISSINWGTVEMPRMLHWRWTIQATHCRTCQCPSVLLFLLRPTCSTFCWSACSRPILTASVIFGTSNSLNLCSTRACFSLATLLSCRRLAAHPAMNKTMDILCKYLCAGIWMYICYTHIYIYIHI